MDQVKMKNLAPVVSFLAAVDSSQQVAPEFLGTSTKSQLDQVTSEVLSSGLQNVWTKTGMDSCLGCQNQNSRAAKAPPGSSHTGPPLVSSGATLVCPAQAVPGKASLNSGQCNSPILQLPSSEAFPERSQSSCYTLGFLSS